MMGDDIHELCPSTGDAVDRRLLSGLVRMLGDLALYGSTFSPLLLEETAAFYKDEGQRMIETADVPHYLAHCEVRERVEGARPQPVLWDRTTRAWGGGDFATTWFVARHVEAKPPILIPLPASSPGVGEWPGGGGMTRV